MQKKQAPEGEPKDKPTPTDQAQRVAEEYAVDQREIIKKAAQDVQLKAARRLDGPFMRRR